MLNSIRLSRHRKPLNGFESKSEQTAEDTHASTDHVHSLLTSLTTTNEGPAEFMKNAFQRATRQGSMTEQPESGELLVGSYLRLIEECELVTYNQRSNEEGNQIEIDVIGVDNTDEGKQVIYTCEVVTHIDGLLYPGTPDTDRWDEYGNNGYQHTIERLWRKFNADREYVLELFDSADSYVFQLWSPVVRGNRDEKYLLSGLYDMANQFEEETGAELELVINEEYTERMEALREKAGETEKDYGELGFRILQILEHMR